MRQTAEKLGQFHGPCYLAAELLKDAEIRNWVARTYPLVMIDEAQDLDENRQGIIRGLAECCTAVVAADAFQCLTDGQEIADFVGWLEKAGTKHGLSQSHRTSKEGLLAAALALRQGANLIDALNKKAIGKAGKVLWVAEGIELAEVPATAKNPSLLAWSIARQLTQGHEDVAIISPDTRSQIIQKAISLVREKTWKWQKDRAATFGPFRASWEGADGHIANQLTETLKLPESASFAEICELLHAHAADPSILAVSRRIHRLHRVTGTQTFAKEQVSEFVTDAIRNISRLGIQRGAKVKVMSIHAAKNREFDRVIILWPQSATGSAEYKRRLLYNGMTRAKTHCTILVLGSGRLNGAPFAT